MTTEKVQRRYGVSDAVMIDASRRYLSQFPEYYLKFSTFDSETFHENFLPLFKDLIETAADIPSDETLFGEIVSETTDVKEVRKEIVAHLGEAKYFIKKASKGDAGFIKGFCYDQLKHVRSSNVGIAEHLKKFNAAVALKREELIASKMPENLLNYFEELEIRITNERDEQIKAKINRIDMTKKRVSILNRIWDTMVVITDANEYANPNDLTAQEIFSLPYPEATSSEESSPEE